MHTLTHTHIIHIWNKYISYKYAQVHTYLICMVIFICKYYIGYYIYIMFIKSYFSTCWLHMIIFVRVLVHKRRQSWEQLKMYIHYLNFRLEIFFFPSAKQCVGQSEKLKTFLAYKILHEESGKFFDGLLKQFLENCNSSIYFTPFGSILYF